MDFENQDNLFHLDIEHSHINQDYDLYDPSKNTSNDIIMLNTKDHSSGSSSVSLSSSVQSFRTETTFSFMDMTPPSASTQSLNLTFQDETSPIDQLLSIFNSGNDAYEDDEKIVEKVEHWLNETLHDPEHLFNQVYDQRDDLKYSSLLAFLYYWGIGTKVNREETFHWYLKAAESGKDFLAQNQVAWCYQMGIGTEKNLTKAFYWYKQSATNGHAGGQSNLGNCFCEGIGTPVQKNIALSWYLKSAK
ncbi:6306_t:CDS:1, partial [Ambispora leptoticha]